MKTLSSDHFIRARRFINTEARPIDRVLFEHRFEGAPADHVVAELGHYRNPDGGFGHALEPDLRTPSSSALCTGIALGLLREVDCPSDHPLVAGAVWFLMGTFDERQRVWRVVPPDTNDYPHAPWWHDEAGSLARTFDDFVIIPRAQLVGLLQHYSDLVPNDWLEAVTETAVRTIETIEHDAFAGGGDTLRYALELAQTAAVPQRFKDRLIPRLRSVADQIVCRNMEEWAGYCPTPLKIAPSPDSAVADVLWDDLQRYLDYTIDHQTAAGTWEPTWTWGDLYPLEWRQAKLEWRGHLTLQTLSSLHAFGRIDT